MFEIQSDVLFVDDVTLMIYGCLNNIYSTTRKSETDLTSVIAWINNKF
jgi:hypothetical protein